MLGGGWGVLTGLLVPVAFRNKCERATGPKPEPFQSIFQVWTLHERVERDWNANRNRCEQGLKLTVSVLPINFFNLPVVWCVFSDLYQLCCWWVGDVHFEYVVGTQHARIFTKLKTSAGMNLYYNVCMCCSHNLVDADMIHLYYAFSHIPPLKTNIPSCMHKCQGAAQPTKTSLIHIYVHTSMHPHT